MHQSRRNSRFTRTAASLAALVLLLASHCVAADPTKERAKPVAPDDSSRSVEIGEILYGDSGGAWGSPSRTAARLARQRELKDKAANVRVAEYEQQPIVPVDRTVPAVSQTSLPLPSLSAPQDAGHTAQWLIPLGGGIVIGLTIAAIYGWNRSRGASSLPGRLLVVSVNSPVSNLPSTAPVPLGTIPMLARRRMIRRHRSVQSHMMSFPKLRVRPTRDFQGESIRQLQTLGVLPLQFRDLAPGTGRPVWLTSAASDDVQMYGGGSDPIPNYAYLEDASRMLAQIEHQKAAEAMVWSNQRWQR